MLRYSALVVAALGLSACVSLLPKSDPARLYVFGPDGDAVQSAAAAARTPVALNAIEFPQASRGDRLLTVTGSEAAYIAESRWAAPAEVMFAESLERVFEARAGSTRLIGRRDVMSGRLGLDVDVRTFEARYERGEGSAPTVVVTLRARLLRYPERSVVGETLIEARRPASENRVGVIVAAFDAAVEQTLDELVTWTDGQVRAEPAPAPV